MGQVFSRVYRMEMYRLARYGRWKFPTDRKPALGGVAEGAAVCRREPLPALRRPTRSHCRGEEAMQKHLRSALGLAVLGACVMGPVVHADDEITMLKGVSQPQT